MLERIIGTGVRTIATLGMAVTMLVNAGCNQQATIPPPIITTPTTLPTSTPTATNTPAPTYTHTPIPPTNTPLPTFTPYPIVEEENRISFEEARAGDAQLRQLYLNQFLSDLQKDSNIIDIWYIESEVVQEKFSGMAPGIGQMINPNLEPVYATTVFYPWSIAHFSPIPFGLFDVYEQVVEPTQELVGSVLVYPFLFDRKFYDSDEYIFSNEADVESYLLGAQKYWFILFKILRWIRKIIFIYQSCGQ